MASIINNVNELLQNFEEEYNFLMRNVKKNSQNMSKACDKIRNSWSGSYAGWHARMYYSDFKFPPLENRFSVEWGAIHGLPLGWAEKNPDEVKRELENILGDDFSIDKLEDDANSLYEGIVGFKDEIEVIFSNIDFEDDLDKEGGLFKEIERIELTQNKRNAFIGQMMPKSIMTRDSNALSEGMVVPSHLYYEGLAQEFKDVCDNTERIIRLTKKLVKSFGMKQISVGGKKSSIKTRQNYVNVVRIDELKKIKSRNFDLKKLIRLCEELNSAFASKSFYSVVLLVRSIIDHVPPIFNTKNFTEMANNYGGSKSFKDSMQHLDNSSRKIADGYLHTQIRKKETIPNDTQVNYSNDLDLLLSEIIRLLHD